MPGKMPSSSEIPAWALMLQQHLDQRLTEMREDLSVVRNEVTGCRADMAALRTELAVVKAEIGALKVQVTDLQNRLHDGDLVIQDHDARLGVLEKYAKSSDLGMRSTTTHATIKNVKTKAPWYIAIAATAAVTVVGTNLAQRFWDVMFPAPKDAPVAPHKP